jgi:hypothetical protein
LDAAFTLGPDSDGFDLDNDDIVLAVAQPGETVFAVTIPAGDWKCKHIEEVKKKRKNKEKKGSCKKKIKDPDKTTMSLQLKPYRRSDDRWVFTFNGRKLPDVPPAGSYDVTLTIGDDTGIETDVRVK